MKHFAAAAIFTSLALLNAVEARGDYTFVKIADVTDRGYNLTPALNNKGQIVYSDDRTLLRSNGAAASTVLEQDIIFDRQSASINSSGTASYVKYRPNNTGADVVVNNGVSSQSVISAVNGNGVIEGVEGSSINDAGVVTALLTSSEMGKTGVYAGTSSVDVSQLYSKGEFQIHGLQYAPVVNNAAQVAFWASAFNEGRSALFLGAVDGSAPTFLASGYVPNLPPNYSAEIAGNFDLNDRGEVAFLSYARDYGDPNSDSRYAINLASGGTITTIASTIVNGPLSPVFGQDGVALNNAGTVAYTLYEANAAGPAIYTGDGRVIGRGDTLDGGTLSNLQFGRFGLNDSGQIAFLGTILNPDGSYRSTGIYLATLRAVPEPGSLGLLALGIGAVVLVARSRRRSGDSSSR